MNPELHLKIVTYLSKLFPDRHISVEIDCHKHVMGERKLTIEFRLYIADMIYEEFESCIDLLAYIKQLGERSEMEVLPSTLKFSDFEKGI